MADISEYLRRQVAKGPKRKKRDGEARTLWNSPTAAAQDDAANAPSESEKSQEKQLSPNHKTSSNKTPSNKTSFQKTSGKSKLDRKAKASTKVSGSQVELPSQVLETAATESADESLEVISEAAATPIAPKHGETTVSGIEPLTAVIEGAPPKESVVSEDTFSEVVSPAARILGASLANDVCDDFKAVDPRETAVLMQETSTANDKRGFAGIESPGILPVIPVRVKDPTPFLPPFGDISGLGASDVVNIGPLQHPQPALPTSAARPRSRPVTVGKAPSLPPTPAFADLSKDEWFLAKYWLSPGPGGVPRSQERFFHFYRFLYSEAARTGSARVYCTEEMAVEMLGPKARGTFTNYRKLGQRFGMFTVHIVGNLGRREDCLPGTYFFLLFPWINQ